MNDSLGVNFTIINSMKRVTEQTKSWNFMKKQIVEPQFGLFRKHD